MFTKVYFFDLNFFLINLKSCHKFYFITGSFFFFYLIHPKHSPIPLSQCIFYTKFGIKKKEDYLHSRGIFFFFNPGEKATSLELAVFTHSLWGLWWTPEKQRESNQQIVFPQRWRVWVLEQLENTSTGHLEPTGTMLAMAGDKGRLGEGSKDWKTTSGQIPS